MTTCQHIFEPPRELNLVQFDESLLKLSWGWLNDPETAELTMTSKFSLKQQQSFYESIPLRAGYKIWGLELGGQLIGAAGLKNFRGSLAEFWCYIGEKKYWGQGLGGIILQLVEKKARSYNLRTLDLYVLRTNTRAVRAYEKAGFRADEFYSNSKILYMLKDKI